MSDSSPQGTAPTGPRPREIQPPGRASASAAPSGHLRPGGSCCGCVLAGRGQRVAPCARPLGTGSPCIAEQIIDDELQLVGNGAAGVPAEGVAALPRWICDTRLGETPKYTSPTGTVEPFSLWRPLPRPRARRSADTLTWRWGNGCAAAVLTFGGMAANYTCIGACAFLIPSFPTTCLLTMTF